MRYLPECVCKCGTKCINLPGSTHERWQETQNIRSDVVHKQSARHEAGGDFSRHGLRQAAADHKSETANLGYLAGALRDLGELLAQVDTDAEALSPARSSSRAAIVARAAAQTTGPPPKVDP